MTEVLFYHLQDVSLEAVLPQLVEKSLDRGWRVVIQAASEERITALDTHLWTWRDDAFLPHGTWRDEDAGDQPVVLVQAEDNPNGAQVRFLVDSAPVPPDPERYERIVLIFDGNDEQSLQTARSAWSDCRKKGLEVTYWQTDPQGRWQKRQ